MAFYLGLDLATVQTGWAIAEVQNKSIVDLVKGTIYFSRSIPQTKRLHRLRNKIKSIANQYPLEPILIKEQPLHNQSRRNSGVLFKAHGYIESLFPGYRFKDMNPIEVKKFVTGYGFSTKDKVEQGVRNLLNLPEYYSFETDDESDAVAILVTGLFSLSIIKNPRTCKQGTLSSHH